MSPDTGRVTQGRPASTASASPSPCAPRAMTPSMNVYAGEERLTPAVVPAARG
ncbi:hypothetical protein ABK046_43145 [Streptomyces caeruleatus]